jgi:hypothetical protein
MVRDDLLERKLRRLAASPEGYLALRGEFAKSLGAISVCSYILGEYLDAYSSWIRILKSC